MELFSVNNFRFFLVLFCTLFFIQNGVKEYVHSESFGEGRAKFLKFTIKS